MLSRIDHWGPRLFTVALLALLAVAGWQWRAGAPISANLLELLPNDTPDLLEQRAEKIIQEPLNRELVVLISFAERQKALSQAAAIGQQWQQEKLFEKVQWDVSYDLAQVRQQVLDNRLALLGSDDRQLLQQNPRAFVERRVQDLFDPFRS